MMFCIVNMLESPLCHNEHESLALKYHVMAYHVTLSLSRLSKLLETEERTCQMLPMDGRLLLIRIEALNNEHTDFALHLRYYFMSLRVTNLAYFKSQTRHTSCHSMSLTRTLVSRPASNVDGLPFSTTAPTTVSAAVRPLPGQHLQHQHRQHSEKSLSKYCANSSRLTSFYLSPDWIHGTAPPFVGTRLSPVWSQICAGAILQR